MWVYKCSISRYERANSAGRDVPRIETLEKLETDPSQLLTAGAGTADTLSKAANSFCLQAAGRSVGWLALGSVMVVVPGHRGLAAPHAAAEGAGVSFAKRALEITESAMTEAEKRERLRQFHDAPRANPRANLRCVVSGAKPPPRSCRRLRTTGSLAALLSSAVRSVGGDRRPAPPVGKARSLQVQQRCDY